MTTHTLIQKELAQLNYPSKFASIKHLASLQSDIEALRSAGKLHEKIDHDYLDFNFEVPSPYKSVLIVSCAIPNSAINIDTSNGIKTMILPTVYFDTQEADAFHRAISALFEQNNILYEKVHLPLKLLGSRTGLTTYGRNNISYVEGFGSYHKLTAYLTSIQIDETPWLNFRLNEQCTNCRICENSCPNQLIHQSSPIIDAGHCLTFPNEIEGEFPEWVNPSWHNALMGCIRCQSTCPINAPFQNNLNHLFTLNDENIQQLLNVEDYNALSEDLQLKLKTIAFHEYFAIFKRNFTALYKNL